MRWPNFRLFGLRRRLFKLQHVQAVEHRVIVDEVKDIRRSATHELADPVFHLHAITEALEEIAAEDDDETDSRPDP